MAEEEEVVHLVEGMGRPLQEQPVAGPQGGGQGAAPEGQVLPQMPHMKWLLCIVMGYCLAPVAK